MIAVAGGARTTGSAANGPSGPRTGASRDDGLHARTELRAEAGSRRRSRPTRARRTWPGGGPVSIERASGSMCSFRPISRDFRKHTLQNALHDVARQCKLQSAADGPSRSRARVPSWGLRTRTRWRKPIEGLRSATNRLISSLFRATAPLRNGLQASRHGSCSGLSGRAERITKGSLEQGTRDARSSVRRRHAGQLRRVPRLHPRLREALIMETLVVSTVAAALLAYLFFSLVRPERF